MLVHFNKLQREKLGICMYPPTCEEEDKLSEANKIHGSIMYLLEATST